MYAVDERDRVIELKDVPQSSVGAPLPVVLSDEFKILLAYIAEESSPGGTDLTVRGDVGKLAADNATSCVWGTSWPMTTNDKTTTTRLG